MHTGWTAYLTSTLQRTLIRFNVNCEVNGFYARQAAIDLFDIAHAQHAHAATVNVDAKAKNRTRQATNCFLSVISKISNLNRAQPKIKSKFIIGIFNNNNGWIIIILQCSCSCNNRNHNNQHRGACGPWDTPNQISHVENVIYCNWHMPGPGHRPNGPIERRESVRDCAVAKRIIIFHLLSMKIKWKPMQSALKRNKRLNECLFYLNKKRRLAGAAIHVGNSAKNECPTRCRPAK